MGTINFSCLFWANEEQSTKVIVMIKKFFIILYLFCSYYNFAMTSDQGGYSRRVACVNFSIRSDVVNSFMSVIIYFTWWFSII